MKAMMRMLAALALVLAAGGLVGAAEPVVIGLEIPLSPPGDPAGGQLIRRGAELAVEYVNTVKKGVLGGRQIRLDVEDTQGRNEVGVAAYRRLVSEDHAVGVTGFFHSSVNIAVNEVAKELGVPTIGTQTSAADVTAKHYDVAFRTHTIDPIRVAAFLELAKKKHFKRVSLVAETTDYGIGIADEMERQNKASKAGLTIQKITFDHATTELTPQLLQVKAFKPDLVVNVGVGQPLDLMIDQATTLGILPKTAMVISYDAPVRPQFWKLHPKDGAGIYFIAYYSPSQKLSKSGRWFAKAYEAKYKEPPVYSSLNGFGDVMILAQAVDHAKSTDPKAVVKALETGTFQSWAATPVRFPKAPGAYWHNWAPPLLILHYTKPGQSWRDAPVVVTHTKTTM
jgi:branched-chain amino acid transport system substrate-binding protein